MVTSLAMGLAGKGILVPFIKSTFIASASLIGASDDSLYFYP
jgi:hypothetical protein